MVRAVPSILWKDATGLKMGGRSKGGSCWHLGELSRASTEQVLQIQHLPQTVPRS